MILTVFTQPAILASSSISLTNNETGTFKGIVTLKPLKSLRFKNLILSIKFSGGVSNT